MSLKEWNNNDFDVFMTACRKCRENDYFEAKTIPYTPIALIDKMFDKIPSIKEEKFDVEIGVVYCIEMAFNLNRRGFTNITMIVGTHDEKIKVQCDKTNMKYKVININEEKNMPKFDVVVGNPPYQHPTNKSMKLWSEIVGRVGTTLNKDGYMAFITPNTWLNKPLSRGFHSATNFMVGKLQFIKVNCSEFFDVGEEIGWWILQNNNSQSLLVDDGNKINTFSAYSQQILNSNPTIDMVQKIEKIFQTGEIVRNNKIIDFYYSTKHAIEKGLLSKDKTPKFDIPVFISANQTVYTEKKNINSSYKIILNKSGYYFKYNDPKYMFIPSTKYYGVGENGVGIPTKNIIEANNALTVYSSKLCRFYIDNEKSSGFNSGLLNLPILDFTRAWTDKELYKHFDLTQEEINYVEANVK